MSGPFFSAYSPAVRQRMFGGRAISPVLPYRSSPFSDEECEQQESDCLSVSGAQEKYSLVMDGSMLRYARAGEQGLYLLKPRPHRMRLRRDMPVNECLSMRMARELFHLPAAECALCFYGDGEAAYLVRRFDVKPDGSKRRMEDLAALGNICTQGNSGSKYEGSYEELAALITRYAVAPRVQLMLFFQYVVVNYLLCNGDAHMKNFALLEDDAGGMVLAPAYDVMNTRLHVEDAPFALSRGLFADGKTESHRGMGAHFLDWAEQIGLPRRLAERFLHKALAQQKPLEEEIRASYLSPKAVNTYLYHTRERFRCLQKGM